MIVVAPDAFKGSLAAERVAEVVADELRRAVGDEPVVEAPIADGGEGTVDVAVRSGMRRVTATVSGPLGSPVDADLAVDGGTAVVELAAAAGLTLVDGDPDPSSVLAATTRGVGELVRHAIGLGAKRIVVGLGGSATTDGGAGLAAALGARLLDADGVEVADGGGALSTIATVDVAPMVALLDGVDVALASDVDNPLLGDDGAAAVYGPQKGADEAAVRRLEAGLAHWADLLAAATGVDARDRPGAGAAGGAGLPLLAATDARVEPGVRVLLAMTGTAEQLAQARLVVTGEGRLDRQTLRGKGPAAVARIAGAAGAEVVAVVGSNELGADELREVGIDRVHAMTDVEPSIEVCLRDADRVLRELARRLAAEVGG